MQNLVPVYVDITTGEYVLQTEENLAGTTFGVQHVQSTPATTWTIVHGKHTTRFISQVFDDQMFTIVPDEIRIVDINTVEITFVEPQTGLVNLIMFL